MTTVRLLGVALVAGAAAAVVHPGSDAEGRSAPADHGARIDLAPSPYDGRYAFLRIRWGDDGSLLGLGRRRGGAEWAHDHPRAERNFLKILEETTLVDASAEGVVLSLDDPDLFRFPVAYIVEPGFWHPTDEEASALGEYLGKGGFLIVDDFRGPYELANLEAQLLRALPESRMVPLDETHPIFDSFFRVVPQNVVPPYGGLPPVWLGIYEGNDPAGRLQVIVNYNNDMAEYWEYSDYGFLPIDLSNEAYKLGVNYVVYALTH